MTQVNIHEAKTHLSKLVDRASAGEPVVIARHGRPVAILSAYPGDVELPPRVGGQLKGKIRVANDFDAPDAEFERLFYDGPIVPPEEGA